MSDSTPKQDGKPPAKKPSKGGRKKGGDGGKSGKDRKNRPDLFADLRQRPRHEIEEELKAIKRQQNVANQEYESIRSERSRQIRVAQAIRGVLSETKDIKAGQRGLIGNIGKREKEIRKMREQRDDLNRRVVLPMKNIEKEIIRVYNQLAQERKDLRYPSLEEEERLFKFFFELQAMYPLAEESNRIHAERLTLIEQQRESIGDLKEKEVEYSEVVDSMTIPDMKGVKATPWEEKSYNKRISKLLEEQRTKRKELRGINREVGRLDAYLRVERRQRQGGQGGQGGRDGKSGRGRPSGRGMRGPDVNEVRRKAASGESMSLSDLGALLDAGGFSSVKPEHAREKRRKKKGSTTKKIGASRGKGSSNRPDFEERRR